MVDWPFAPAAPRAVAVRRWEPPPPPAGRLAELRCACCWDLPKVEDPAQGRRPPEPWSRPASPPLRLHWLQLLRETEQTAGPASEQPDCQPADGEGEGSEDDGEPFHGFSPASLQRLRPEASSKRRAVSGSRISRLRRCNGMSNYPPGEEAACHPLRCSPHTPTTPARDVSFRDSVDIFTIAGDDVAPSNGRAHSRERGTREEATPQHRKHRKRKGKHRRWSRSPDKRRKWIVVGKGSRSKEAREARAAVRAATASLVGKRASAIKPPKERPASPPKPPPPVKRRRPLQEVIRLPLLYEVMDQAAALELLYADMPLPVMTGDQLERIGLQYGPVVEYEETADDHCQPPSLLELLREAAEAEREALGYPPLQRAAESSEPDAAAAAETPADVSLSKSRRWPSLPRSQRRLPAGMTQPQWEVWRRLLPTRKGRPRVYPRPDDLRLIDRYRQVRPTAANARPLQHFVAKD